MSATAQELLSLSREVAAELKRNGYRDAALLVSRSAEGGDPAALGAVRQTTAQMITRYAGFAGWRHEREREIAGAMRRVADETRRWESGPPPLSLLTARQVCRQEADLFWSRGPSFYALRAASCDQASAVVACLAAASRSLRAGRLFFERMVDLAMLHPIKPLPPAIRPEIYTALDDLDIAITRAGMTLRAEKACRARGWAGEKEPTE